jgi:heptosyltransferase II
VATGPLSENAAVIKHKVECNPCFLRECPTDFRCMKGVMMEEVVSAAEKILDNDRAAPPK